MRCGYKVRGIIFLHVYLCIYSLLRGVTLTVLHLSSYVLNPMTLSLLEVVLELLLWNSC